MHRISYLCSHDLIREIEFDEFSIYLTGVPKLISNSNKIQKVYVARLVYTAGPLHCCEKVS